MPPEKTPPTLEEFRAQAAATGLPLTSEDLGGLLTHAHPAALVQLDMKNERAEVGDAHNRHLASHFGGFAGQLIVSGASESLIADLADAVPGLAVAGAGLGGNGLAGTIATALTVPARLRDA